MRERHQLPNIEIEGLNVEEKETRHDLDKKSKKDADIRKRDAATGKNISE